MSPLIAFLKAFFREKEASLQGCVWARWRDQTMPGSVWGIERIDSVAEHTVTDVSFSRIRAQVAGRDIVDHLAARAPALGLHDGHRVEVAS